MTNLQNSPESSADFQEVLYKVRHFLQYILGSFQMQRVRWERLSAWRQRCPIWESLYNLLYTWRLKIFLSGWWQSYQMEMGQYSRCGWVEVAWGWRGFVGGWWMMLIGRERCETDCVISRAGGRRQACLCDVCAVVPYFIALFLYVLHLWSTTHVTEMGFDPPFSVSFALLFSFVIIFLLILTHLLTLCSIKKISQMECINSGTNSVVSLQPTPTWETSRHSEGSIFEPALKALLEFDYLRANSISLNIYRPLRADCKD